MNEYVVLEEDLSRSVSGSPYILESARLNKTPFSSIADRNDIVRPLGVLRLQLGDRSLLAIPQDADYIDVRIRLSWGRFLYLDSLPLTTANTMAGEAGRDIKRAALLWAEGMTREEFHRTPRETSEVFSYLACFDLLPLSVSSDHDYRRREERFIIRFGLLNKTTKPVSDAKPPEPAVQSSPTIQTPKRTIIINKRR